MSGNGRPFPISWLFVPADKPAIVAKARAGEGEIVIVDLEDAVAAGAKAVARAQIAGYLAVGTDIAIRINPPATVEGLRDLMAILSLPEGPRFVVVPKSETVGVLQMVAALIEEAGHDSELIALIESAVGLCASEALARSGGRLRGAMFGAADMGSDLGCKPGGAMLDSARRRIAVACAAARIAAIDTPSFVLDDPDGIGADAQRARALGMAAKAAIHPRQIGPIHAAFCPSGAELERARKVVELAAQGVGILDGEMIDEAMARSSRALLERWG